MQIALNNYNLNNLVINKQWNYTIGATWRHFFDNSNLFFVMSRNHLDNTALKYFDYADENSQKIIDYKSEEIENKIRLEYNFKKNDYSIIIGSNLEDATYTNNTTQKFTVGDSIITEAASSAQVLLMDQTTLTIGESSELIIDEFVYDPQTKIGKIISSVKIGTVKIITGEISKTNPDNLEIKTPTGSIGARGTEFAVVTESDTKSTVVLLGSGVNNTL